MFGVGDAVNAGGTAAPVVFGEGDEFDAGDGAEDLERGFGHVLAMVEVATGVIGDGGFRFGTVGGCWFGGAEIDLDEVLVDVADFVIQADHVGRLVEVTAGFFDHGTAHFLR